MEVKIKDEGTERGVLAGLVQYGGKVYSDIAHLIDADCFVSEANQIIWLAIKSILDQDMGYKLDIPSILSASSSLGLKSFLDTNVESRFLQALKNFYIESENVKELALRLRKLEVTRRLKNQTDKINKSLEAVTGAENMSEILGLVETPIYDTISQLYASTKNEIETIDSGLDAYLAYLADNPTDMVGIPTGFPSYDMAIGGGLRGKTLNVIVARPKSFKTSMLDNMALHISHKLGIPVLNMDSEMSKQEHWVKLLANLSGVPIREIETGKFAQNIITKSKVMSAFDELQNIPYNYVSINGRPFDEVLSLIRRWLIQKVGFDKNGNIKPCVVFYDYLKILDPGELKNMSEHQILGFQTNALHTIAHKYEIPILAFVQANRDGIRVEDSSIVSGSDRVVWNCSNLSLLKRKSAEEISMNKESNGNLKLTVLLARHGAGLESGYIDLYARGDICKIVDAGTVEEQSVTETETDSHVPNEIVPF